MSWHLVAHSNSPADLVCADCWIGYQTVPVSYTHLTLPTIYSV